MRNTNRSSFTIGSTHLGILTLRTGKFIAMGSRKIKFRTLLFLLSPLLFSALVSSYLIVSIASTELQSQANRFGQGVTDHLAISVLDHLIANDRLSLNVLLAELMKKDNFDYASVLDSSGNLVAQAGRRSPNSRMFSQQVTFQDSVMGAVQTGFRTDMLNSRINGLLIVCLSAHALLIAIVGFLIYCYGDLIYLLVALKRSVTTKKTPSSTAEIVFDEPAMERTFLVLKLRPARLLAKNLPKIRQAISLYGGRVEQVGDDLLVTFDQANQLFQAVCSGLLTIELFSNSNIQIKAALHQARDVKDNEAVEKARKHTSYLASMAEHSFLTSKQVATLLQTADKKSDAEKYQLTNFHSTMTPDGEVYMITGLENQALIKAQALTLNDQSL
jgi:hypothetical protein